MRTEWFIVRRLIRGAEGSSLLARPAVLIAVITLALGMTCMSLSVIIVNGFKKSITEKLTGFTAHIRISAFDLNQSFESKPIDYDSSFIRKSKAVDGIRNLYPYAYKNGIIKTDNEVQGIVLKGYDSLFTNTVFYKSLKEGEFRWKPVDGKPPVIISRKTADMLKKKTGDDLLVYFIQDPPRVRKMTITGIYDTGMEEFDKVYAFGQLDLIQKLNGWTATQFSGYEAELTDFRLAGQIKDKLDDFISPLWQTETIYDLFPQIFNWLELINVNTVIIVSLILIVALINLVIVMLILILEQTFFTGIMKSLGAEDGMIRRVFILLSVFVLLTGMAAGNSLAGVIVFLQKKYEWIRLSEESYYMSSMPVHVDFVQLLLLNGGVILVSALVLVIPSFIIRNISPLSALRFD